MFNSKLIEKLDLSEWNRSKEVGLIIAPCGAGKTYNSINVFPELLNVKPEETLLLFPRAAIKNQTLIEYADKTTEYVYESSFTEKDKINIATVHAIGKKYRHEGLLPQMRLVIVDEWHTLFSENNFASDLLYFQMAFQEWIDDANTMIICLTATEVLPLNFIYESPFDGLNWLYQNRLPQIPIKCICKDIEPTYKANEVIIERNKSLEMCLRALPASDNSKQIIFVKGKIERLIALAESDSNAGWLCSMSSTKKIGDVKARDLMNEAHYQSIISGYFPEGINRMYLSSAYREGLNIKDESVKQVIIDGCTDIDIVQSLGRVRHDTDKLVIVIDKRRYLGTESKVKHAIELLESNEHDSFEHYYAKQVLQESDEYEGKKDPVLIYKDKDTGDYLFNYYALRYWLYCEYSLMCSDKDNHVWFNRKLPNYEEYYEKILNGYHKSAIQYEILPHIKPNTIEQYNKETVKQFDFTNWHQVTLYADSAKEFANALNLKNRDYSTMAISGIYKNYPELFIKKKSISIDGKRKTAYVIK